MENDARIENRTLARKTKENFCSELCSKESWSILSKRKELWKWKKYSTKEKCNLFILQIYERISFIDNSVVCKAFEMQKISSKNTKQLSIFEVSQIAKFEKQKCENWKSNIMYRKWKDIIVPSSTKKFSQYSNSIFLQDAHIQCNIIKRNI
jgi:hypothetical protein